MRLKNRLEKLERDVTPPKSEYERRVEAVWELYAEPLARTMSEPHVQVLLSALEQLDLDWTQGDRHEGAFWLYHFFHGVMLEHWHAGRPLALPHAVGEAVMRYHAGRSAWDCEECGYRSPMKPQAVIDVFRGEPVSPICLLCGAR